VVKLGTQQIKIGCRVVGEGVTWVASVDRLLVGLAAAPTGTLLFTQRLPLAFPPQTLEHDG
jgi:hypothetical protein